MANNPVSSSRHHGYSSESTAAVRLLSSVAVVGRDNEPIYLRGDLCDCAAIGSSSPDASAAAATMPSEKGGEEEGIHSVGSEAKISLEGDGGDDGDDGSTSNGSPGSKGLLGRFKGAVGRNGNIEDLAGEEGERDPNGGDSDDDDYGDDPFGFFGNGTDPSRSSGDGSGESPGIPAMSLTQQLVLHASLDRFEEMASRSNRGGAVRWRTPGSSNAANAMWMGLLCQVEERWNVYGYLTNTGIKFMILVENIYLNHDGTRRRQDHAPPSSLSLFVNNSLPSSSSSSTSSREADLKNMFARLHELYVRHTLNPFSKLRGPIRSRAFDEGIVGMARSHNGAALEKALSSEGAFGGGSNGGGDGTEWM